MVAARPWSEPSITPKEEVVRRGLAYQLGVGFSWGDWTIRARPWKEEAEANEHDMTQHGKWNTFWVPPMPWYKFIHTQHVSLFRGKSVSFRDQSKLQTDVPFPQFEAFHQMRKVSKSVFVMLSLLWWLTLQGIWTQRVENIGWKYNQGCLRGSQSSNSCLEVNCRFYLVLIQDIN